MKNLAPIKNLVTASVTEYFSDNPTAIEWRVSAVRLLVTLHENPLNAGPLRAIKPKQINRCLKEMSVRQVRRWKEWVFENPSRPGSTIKISDGIYLQ